jgi:formamidopyrimidine-DNA glycosylase
MPELPEVESLRQYLVREGLVGRVIERVDVEDKPSPEKGTGAISGIASIRGRTVTGFNRRGKQMAAVLDVGVMGMHMGMTGQIDVLGADEAIPRFARAVFTLTGGMRIVLVDPRRWAKIQYFDSLDALFDGIGPDALDPDYTAAHFAKSLRGRKAQIKPLLLNQAIIAGVGNIYADEALHRVGISPARRVNEISGTELFELFGAIRESLEQSLEFILAHPDDRGRPFIVDAYDDRMRLDRKPGSFCPRCEIPLVTLKFGNRTAYYCGNCQR